MQKSVLKGMVQQLMCPKEVFMKRKVGIFFPQFFIQHFIGEIFNLPFGEPVAKDMLQNQFGSLLGLEIGK